MFQSCRAGNLFPAGSKLPPQTASPCRGRAIRPRMGLARASRGRLGRGKTRRQQRLRGHDALATRGRDARDTPSTVCHSPVPNPCCLLPQSAFRNPKSAITPPFAIPAAPGPVAWASCPCVARPSRPCATPFRTEYTSKMLVPRTGGTPVPHRQHPLVPGLPAGRQVAHPTSTPCPCESLPSRGS
jgi:hypothetical protein